MKRLDLLKTKWLTMSLMAIAIGSAYSIIQTRDVDYMALEVNVDASPAEIKTAYLNIMKQLSDYYTFRDPKNKAAGSEIIDKAQRAKDAYENIRVLYGPKAFDEAARAVRAEIKRLSEPARESLFEPASIKASTFDLDYFLNSSADTSKDLYAILGVRKNATSNQIEAAWQAILAKSPSDEEIDNLSDSDFDKVNAVLVAQKMAHDKLIAEKNKGWTTRIKERIQRKK